MAHRQYTRQSPSSRLASLYRKLPKHWFSTLVTLGGIGLLFCAGTVLWWSKDLPNPQTISQRQITESTKIYDRTGQNLLYEIGDIHRTSISLDNISINIKNATLAAEDDQFYQHHGLDWRGILRGVILKPLTGQRAQGGSTITQQLIKNAVLTSERTVQRKVKEAVLALELEQRFTKDEILEMYLNDIPYGNQAYGVQAATKTFFNKSANEITLAEAAFLSSLPKAPTYYSPYGSHFEDLKQRQEYILNRMASLNMITQQQASAAKQEKVTFTVRNESIQAPHFVFYIKELLDQEFGERIVEQGGLTIITTLDPDLQKKAEDAITQHRETINNLGASNAALSALDPKTGDILAMVGSADYFDKSIDGNVNVAIRHRSPGSSIKPFVYAAAFQEGYTPSTILVDAETDFGQGYKPKNYDLKERGPVTMRDALANSLNIPAVKTLYLAGVKQATKLAADMGMSSLTDPDRYGLSLVLGGGEVRLLDEVNAYATFANEGTYHPSRGILKVTKGKDVLIDTTQKSPESKQIIDPQIARLVTNILSDNNARATTFGLNSPLQLGSRPVAAKTGTTQKFRDGWTMGYTPSLAAGVWVGNNDNSTMQNRSAGTRTAAPIWNTFMREALTNTPIEQFVKPEPYPSLPHGVLRGEIPEVKGKWEKETGIIYTADCPIALGQPKTFQELHNILFYVRRSDPLGQPPANAESDPQFNNWETGVAVWRDKNNEKNKDNPEKPYYSDSLPEPICEASDNKDLPKVTITEPNTTILRSSPVTIKASVESPQELNEVRFIFDGQEIARKKPNEAYETQISFPDNFQGRKTLQIIAITKEKLIGSAHRTFIINPDDQPPSVTLHTPINQTTLKPTDFPNTIKVTASDNNGIQTVDILYKKDGQSGTHRIDRTSTQFPTAPNRYEVIWQDSPGPGTYHVFARVYDTTGNFTDSKENTVTIE